MAQTVLVFDFVNICPCFCIPCFQIPIRSLKYNFPVLTVTSSALYIDLKVPCEGSAQDVIYFLYLLQKFGVVWIGTARCQCEPQTWNNIIHILHKFRVICTVYFFRPWG
jgi:hypothetical protein